MPKPRAIQGHFSSCRLIDCSIFLAANILDSRKYIYILVCVQVYEKAKPIMLKALNRVLLRVTPDFVTALENRWEGHVAMTTCCPLNGEKSRTSYSIGSRNRQFFFILKLYLTYLMKLMSKKKLPKSICNDLESPILSE